MESVFKDQLGSTITLKSYPERIISLVPSQTELLYDLGLEAEVVGITKFCVHPKQWYRQKTRVGGTKKLHLDRIRELQPDLIIGNKEENEEKQIRELMKEYPVWMSDVHSLEDAVEMIKSVGKITGTAKKAENLVEKIKTAFNELPKSKPFKVGYFIWRKPYMVVGGDTFINDMLKRCGWINVFEKKTGRYPEVTEKEISKAELDYILLSSEPFPFKEKYKEEFQALSPQSKVVLVDGEMFSWYGSRLLKAKPYLEEMINALNR